MFDDLDQDISILSTNGFIMLLGDLNARTGSYPVSFVDYIILHQELFFKTDYFIMKRPTYLPDHSQIVTWLNTNFENNYDCENYNNYKSLNKLPTKFIWEPESTHSRKNSNRKAISRPNKAYFW